MNEMRKLMKTVEPLFEHVNEDEVMSMQAGKAPLVLAGRPFEWDVYDTRNDKKVAEVAGGSEMYGSHVYEININKNGIPEKLRMPPMYTLTTGPGGEPPYQIFSGNDTVVPVEEGLGPYELVERELGAKIMDIDDGFKLGYIDVDPEDDEHITYLGNKS